MKTILPKVLLVALFSAFGMATSQGQGFEPYAGMKQFNFGIGVSNWGIPVYAGMDFGLTDHITLGPVVSVRATTYSTYYDYIIFGLGFRGDYHFANHIDALPEELDLYGGITVGYSIWTYDYEGVGDPDPRKSRPFASLNAGGRWYFSDNWAAQAEGHGGTFSGMKVGLSYLFD